MFKEQNVDLHAIFNSLWLIVASLMFADAAEQSVRAHSQFDQSSEFG